MSQSYFTAYSGLPAFLVKDGGLNSGMLPQHDGSHGNYSSHTLLLDTGFMLAQCTAASLGWSSTLRLVTELH